MNEDGPPTDDGSGRKEIVGEKTASRGWRVVRWVVFLTACVAGGLFHRAISKGILGLVPSPSDPREVRYRVSPHDPARHFDRPGKDAMGMALVPVYEGEEAPKTRRIEPEIQESEFTTETVERGPLVRTLRTVSTVEYAEPLVGEVSLKVDAWLENLQVDYEGQLVRKGEVMFEAYSPDLLSVMQDLVIAARYARSAPSRREETARNMENVRRRLLYWDVTADQVKAVEQSDRVPRTVRFSSPHSGVVVEKRAFDGKYVSAGEMLYRIADLSKVWVYVYVYQDETHCVYEGQPAFLRLPGLPGRSFSGKVVYIYPFLEPKIRAMKVRLEFENPELLLKPDMFVHVDLAPHKMGEGLNIPQSVVLDTGRRRLVYVVGPDDTFEPREIRTGMRLDGGRVEVLSGLKEGETLVASSHFLMDSESRVRSVGRKFRPLTPSEPGEHENMPGMEALPGMEAMPGMPPAPESRSEDQQGKE